MSVKQKLENDLKSAMLARDDLIKTTLRMALSAVKLKEVEVQGALEDSDVLVILQREVKARQEAIADARKASRPDLIVCSYAPSAIVHGVILKREAVHRPSPSPTFYSTRDRRPLTITSSTY